MAECEAWLPSTTPTTSVTLGLWVPRLGLDGVLSRTDGLSQNTLPL